MLIAASTDGLRFRSIGGPEATLYAPAGGVRDPSVMWWQGQWWLVYSYGPNRAPLLFLATSPDLRRWTPAGSLRLMADSVNNYVDVPQWIVDPEGAGGVTDAAAIAGLAAAGVMLTQP